MVGHDLRNMLNAIIGSAGLIALEARRDNHVDAVLLHAQRIGRASARMNRLVGDLVDVATIETEEHLRSRMFIADPGAIVNEAVETFEAQAKANGITLIADTGQATFSGRYRCRADPPGRDESPQQRDQVHAAGRACGRLCRTGW